MRSLSVTLVLSACTLGITSAAADTLQRSVELAGQLEDPRLIEVSGLVGSRRNPTRLWMLNDGGAEPSLHATDGRGGTVGELLLDPAQNRDWEDLALVELDGKPYLVAADIGDNDSDRDDLRLYVVAEPDLEKGQRLSAVPDWQVDFGYPDGPRDAESLAVDANERRAYVLSKRDLPPRLYSLPIDAPEDGAPVTADYLGPVTSLPPPPPEDIAAARRNLDWHWQPTAMDFSADGRRAAVLTYRAVYLYTRDDDQSWYDALNAEPQRFDIGGIRDAESLAFAADGRSLLLTVERQHAPLFRVDLRRASTPDRQQKADIDQAGIDHSGKSPQESNH